MASHILIGINGDVIPAELEELGSLTALYPQSGLGHYILTIRNWHIDSVPEMLAVFTEEPYVSYVRFAEPDWVVTANLLPNDPNVQNGTQWAVRNQPSGADINAEAGWDIRTRAEDVVVAIIDSGINEVHEDLVDNLWTNPNEIAGNGLDDDNNGVVDDVFGFNAITG
ncbi:MAG: hypothetical protein O7C75_06620, partial [Verrucomicrobia bacterium]|nr:hypothetical protein [Verrucomicrobiota bacterium]